jgi:hypothetical protein
MVFEVERFRMVTANDVLVDELPKALPEFRELPLTGPRVMGARRPEMGAERNDAMFMGVSGIDVGQRPIFWQPYAQTQARALERSKPVAARLKQKPDTAADTPSAQAEMKADEATARFLPVMARKPWVAVLDKTGALLGYLPLDGFF